MLPPNLYLMAGERAHIGRRMHTLIVQSALAGPVRVLIGGNRFDLYSIAYALAAQVGDRFYHILENHITLSRAEICPQIVELLLETETRPVTTLVTDFLTPFYDDGFPDSEVDNLLFDSILELRRLSTQAPVIVSAHPAPPRLRLFHALERAADEVFPLLPPQPQTPSFHQPAFT
ncbi:MAG: hypothetical protein IH859_06070 [Chloroflexi bacterium]|nr:hypothetical protein [Chloroflexota bacterium]